MTDFSETLFTVEDNRFGMGFHREGNQKTASIGRDILLVESFLKHGYVVEVENAAGHRLQCSVDSARLENPNYEKVREITDKVELQLNELSFEEAKRQAKRQAMG